MSFYGFCVTAVFLLLPIAYLLRVWLKRHYTYWQRRGVPQKEPAYFLGNMKGIGTKYNWTQINKSVYNGFESDTPFVGFYSFMTRSLFVRDLDLIKQIMIKDFSSFADRGLFHNERDDPLTGNLLFLDGDPWRTLRHKLSPVFTSGKMRFMFPTMTSVSERMIEVCDNLVAGNGGNVEAKDLCARYTTDVIGTCAFGIECNSLINPDAEFRRMGKSIFEEPRHSTLVQAFMFTNPALAQRLRMKNFRDDVSEFFMRAVKETVAYRRSQQIKRNDFMDMLIELLEKREAMDPSLEDDFQNGLNIEQVAAQCMVFFLAGFDTSSTTMSFCIYELALNPDIQERLRSEIKEVLERHRGQVTYESIKEMRYLDMVISETLRKYSVLPHMVRQTVTSYKMPNSNLVLEPGTRIMIPVDCIHHDPKYYEEPEKFNPDRFTPEEIAKRHPFAYLPFGDGPRNCIGKRFGLMQAGIGVVTLLRHFQFSTTERTQIPLKYSKKSFLVATESGIHLKVERL